MSFFEELKRRNVFRVGAAYLVFAWLIVQLVETILPAFGFGDGAVRNVVIVLAVGFVPALIVAWAFELTEEGFKRDSEVDRTQPGASISPRVLNRALIVLLTNARDEDHEELLQAVALLQRGVQIVDLVEQFTHLRLAFLGRIPPLGATEGQQPDAVAGSASQRPPRGSGGGKPVSASFAAAGVTRTPTGVAISTKAAASTSSRNAASAVRRRPWCLRGSADGCVSGAVAGDAAAGGGAGSCGGDGCTRSVRRRTVTNTWSPCTRQSSRASPSCRRSPDLSHRDSVRRS